MLRNSRFATLFAAIVTAALAAGSAAPASGASFTVNATYDAVDAAPGDGVCADAGGACTLRAAVEETNALAGADAIAVPAGEYGGALLITDSVTIDGAGAASTTIRGPSPNGAGSVFSIRCGYPQLSVAISGVLITAGLNRGGGIYNCGHTVTLRAVTIGPNGGAGFDGGGVWNSGTLSIVDSAIVNNWAQEGGAILNDPSGQVRIVNSTLSANLG